MKSSAIKMMFPRCRLCAGISSAISTNESEILQYSAECRVLNITAYQLCQPLKILTTFIRYPFVLMNQMYAEPTSPTSGVLLINLKLQ
jgi:hypothetical protein